MKKVLVIALAVFGPLCFGAEHALVDWAKAENKMPSLDVKVPGKGEKSIVKTNHRQEHMIWVRDMRKLKHKLLVFVKDCMHNPGSFSVVHSSLDLDRRYEAVILIYEGRTKEGRIAREKTTFELDTRNGNIVQRISEQIDREAELLF